MNVLTMALIWQHGIAKRVMIELAFYCILNNLFSFGDFTQGGYPVFCTTDTGEGLMAGKLSVRTVRTLARKAGFKNAARLGRALDISENTIYRWWNDDPTLQFYDRDILLKLCTVFKCEPGELITIVTEEEQSL